MKNSTKLVSILLLSFSLSAVTAQTEKQITTKKATESKVLVPSQETATKGIDVKSQLIKDWRFHEITLRTPKDGYLFKVSDKEVAMVNLLIANYTFNEDESITLDPNYMEKQGVKSAKWEINSSGNLEITYYWTAEKQKLSGYTNDYEKLEYKIDKISEQELLLNMSEMFIINLIVKTKK